MKLKFINGDRLLSVPEADEGRAERASAGCGFPIFDANLYLGPCPFRALQEEKNPRVLLQNAEAQLGLFNSWSALFHKDWRSGFLRDACHADRGEGSLRWNGIVNPTFPKWREDFVGLRSKHRFCSVKICPGLLKEGWNDDTLRQAASFARSESLPLVLTRRLVDDRLVPDWLKLHPVDGGSLLAFLEETSGTRLILSHFSAPEISDLVESGAQAMDHVFFEVGFQTPLIGWYEQLVSQELGGRLVYASGYPLHYCAGMAGILQARVSPLEKKRILYENALRLFDL